MTREPTERRAARRDRLYAATAEAHAQLETQTAQRDFWADVSGYKRYLVAFAQARHQAERDVWRVAPDLAAAFLDETVLTALEGDLLDFGFDPTVVRQPRREDGEPWAAAEVAPAGAALGALYVLEGSNLGATVVRRRVAALGLTDRYGARHLAAQAARVRRWPLFVAHLNAAALSDAEDAAATDMALRVFALFSARYSETAA